MAGFKVVVTDQVFPDIDIERELIEAAGGTIEVATGSREQVLATAADADALLCTYFPLGAVDLGLLKNCKIIARYGIGVDNVDLETARVGGIVVTNVPDYCVEEVALHTVALVLAMVRKIAEGDALVRSGGWGSARLGEVRRLSTLTVGLLGYGRIARDVAAILRPLTAGLLVHDPFVTWAEDRLVDLPTLLAESDVLSVHCPLTSETRGLVDAAALARMKPGALLVNTSRGPIVVLDDVVRALTGGTLGGAALDVFESEPPPGRRLAEVPRLLMTPHSAFYSREAIKESQRKAATQVLKALRGEPLDYRVA
ncbi:C-terminal binding protein [Paractinoplanes rishiriensis]|uniref:D-isomer specific 2-hydroxyacid dehydrogenase family protein n=1 Tax=Paractinoplanes rishiriensis TaxID=1050105 RepID=A0A919K4F3_9ACTN|nr:C-terminal binding protein [Actinoplanes rishiriensis]GIE99988.1 D-isomer specific 2-hydroxyacid dehydrogenase family protein [Actinoplanes rishiriensis]